MPPRAFPYPLRVGTDICYIPRIRAILTSRLGDSEDTKRPLAQFLSKLLTWPERNYFWSRFQSPTKAYENIDRVSRYLAGRWAAKEACRKACTHLGMSNGLHHIMILPVQSDRTSALYTRPQGLILRERLAPHLEPESPEKRLKHIRHAIQEPFDINSLDGQLCEISISHDDKFAQAVAIVSWVDNALDVESGDWEPAPMSGEFSLQDVYNGFQYPLGDPTEDDTAASPVPQDAPQEPHDSKTLQALIQARRAALETRKRQLAELAQLKKMDKHTDKELTARTKWLQDRNHELVRLVRIANLKAKIAESEMVLSRHANSENTLPEHTSTTEAHELAESVTPGNPSSSQSEDSDRPTEISSGEPEQQNVSAAQPKPDASSAPS